MDRLSDAARGALGAYRDTLALEERRVDCNWAAIERRAMDDVAPDDDAFDDDVHEAAPVVVPRARNTVAILAAAVAVAAAIVAVVAVGPGLVDEHTTTPQTEAPYGVGDRSHGTIEADRGAAETRGRSPRAATGDVAPIVETPIVETPSVETPSVETPSVDAPSVDASPATPRTSARPHRPTAVAPPAVEPPAVEPPAAEPPAAAPDPAAQLLAETALLRKARAALRDGDHDAALAATDEYDRRFVRGTLAEEIAFVRLSALCDAGRIDEGRAAARKFAQRYPGSPLSARAAKSCGPS